MRLVLLLLATWPLLGGCQTHLALRDNTLRTSGTLTDLNYQQVLNNVALFTANPSSMPAIAVITSGTVTVADQKTINGSATYSPTLTFAQQGGGALPLLSLFLNPSVQRNLTENWSMVPVTDIDSMRRIRCAMQLLVLNGGETTDCDHCVELLEQFYLGETKRMDCLIPKGWYHVGCKNDVPKNACYVGHYCDCYVWVMPDGVEGLTRFSMTILELAAGKPHAPTKTVVKTFKADGTLDSTQVTTTEIDQAAVEKMMKDPRTLHRPREYMSAPMVNPGLFFVPH